MSYIRLKTRRKRIFRGITHFILGAVYLAMTLSSKTASAQSSSGQKLQAIIIEFVNGYKKLNIEELGLDYKLNLKHIPSVDTLDMRQSFFDRYQKIAKELSHSKLTGNERLQLQHLCYQVNFERKRVTLEKKFQNELPGENVWEGGLSKLHDGKEWYALYVDKYVSKPMPPDSLLALGEEQVQFVTRQLLLLQNKLGYKGRNEAFYKMLKDSSFVLTDIQRIKDKYREIQEVVLTHLANQFADVDIQPVTILPSPQSGPQTPPAYFDSGVFYFNFYQNKHTTRNMDYLFLHEGIPGHHYDMEEFEKRQQYPLEKLFTYSYNGCFEGWAAYCEYLGKSLGLYTFAYSEIGRWQWDLVRSARVVMDVGIHYKGWTKEQALAYWKKTIPGQDDIAEREVSRCINWPCQVLSYKVGEMAILKLKNYAQQMEGSQFDIRKFHTLILSRLKLPLQVMETSVFTDMTDTAKKHK